MFSLLLAPYPVKDKVPVILNSGEWFLYDGKIGLNPLSTIVLFLNSLKTSRFSDAFRRYRSGTMLDNGLIK